MIPVKCGTYGYDTFPNVVTSLEFERILSASGPFGGHLVRPSDHKEPKKIAWLQCVGSRDREIRDTYCSSVCCMYAIKAGGDRQGARSPIRWIPPSSIWTCAPSAKISNNTITAPKTSTGSGSSVPASTASIPCRIGDLQVRYVDESGEVKDEVFDMIVLSVGMEVSQAARELAETLGVDANAHDFVEQPRRLRPSPPPGKASMSAAPCRAPRTFPNRSCRPPPRPGRRAPPWGTSAGPRPKPGRYPPPRTSNRKTNPASGCLSATAASTSGASSMCRSCRNMPGRCLMWPT